MQLGFGMAGKAGLQDFQNLLAEGGIPELGPGPRPGILPHAELSKRLDGLLAGTTLPSVSRDLICGLVLLWHDRMEPAHNIAQGIANADGSFLHAILHRREPDYGNAAYWFRRVGGHGCFPKLATRVEEMLNATKAESLKGELISDGEWDPFAFITLCEKAAKRPAGDAQTELLRKVQAVEMEVLLEWFFKP